MRVVDDILLQMVLVSDPRTSVDRFFAIVDYADHADFAAGQSSSNPGSSYAIGTGLPSKHNISSPDVLRSSRWSDRS